MAGRLGYARRTAIVERPHRQLRPRLADRLCRDDPYRLPDVDETPGRQIAAIALTADAAAGLAGEDRANLDPLDARLLDPAGQLVGDRLVGLDDRLAGEGVVDLFLDDPAQNAVAERLERLAALHDRRDDDPVEGPAVLLLSLIH